MFSKRLGARVAITCLPILVGAAAAPVEAQPLPLEKVVKVTTGPVYRVVDPFVLVCAATGAPLTIVPMRQPPRGAFVELKDCNRGAFGRYPITFAPEGGTTVEGRAAYKVGGGMELDSGPATTFKLLDAKTWGAF